MTGRFPRRERLTTSADFRALFQRGKHIDRPSTIILWRESVEPRRVGFAVSRQVRRAVDRNRVRRRLREAYRATREAAPACGALVVIGKPSALRAPFKTLADEMRGALAALTRARA
ncbi:MAG: ribonuclease P protein component [Candidatus Rokubacteria bacterium 13_2_20CM_69_15_2]|nr:MAG: ribonuclease P protein component [Candidatus Rokubacteria bacterium 13_2_20CM_69_15_2]PYO20431.1 MAG: ribonuclease P protein component [Candidatus Rokubacteria bacterium]